MTKEKLLADIEEYRKEHPAYRKGQAAFNYIDQMFKVARVIQFTDGIDCFYRDDLIDEFIDKALERINNVKE